MSTPADLDTIDAVRARLARLDAAIAGIRARAEGLAHDTAWQSPAAAAFRLSVADWDGMLSALARRTDRLRDDLWATRVRIATRIEAEGG